MLLKLNMAERKNVLEIKDGGRFERVIWKSKMADISEKVLEIKHSGH